MQWEAPRFTRIPAGAELGYTNELDRDPTPTPTPAPTPAPTPTEEAAELAREAR